MTLRVLCLSLSVLLVGCPSAVQPEDYLVGEDLCETRQGLADVARYEHGALLDITCNDGTLIEARLGRKTKDSDVK